jgi:biotin---protein ligase
MEIFIYRDRGAGPKSVRETVRTLRLLEPTAKIKLVKASFFLEEEWESRCSVLVFPGGRDLPYVEALSGQASQRIRDYVLSGGKYWGICAGAYFASQYIEFEKGEPLEVCGLRELGFFPGKAVGPLFEKNVFRYDSFEGARAAKVCWNGEVFPLFYHGGCTFERAQDHPEVEVLASYHSLPGQPPAIILSKVGQGRALLSGVHPEYCPSTFRQLECYTELSQAQRKRGQLLRKIWQVLIRD